MLVGFRGAYHAILGRPCYAKFMAVPNYTYLKLKMSGLRGVITVGTTHQHAYQCETDNGDVTAIASSTKDLEVIQARTPETAPGSNRSARSFEPTDWVREVQLDPEGDKDKTVKVAVAMTPK